MGNSFASSWTSVNVPSKSSTTHRIRFEPPNAISLAAPCVGTPLSLDGSVAETGPTVRDGPKKVTVSGFARRTAPAQRAPGAHHQLLHAQPGAHAHRRQDEQDVLRPLGGPDEEEQQPQHE